MTNNSRETASKTAATVGALKEQILCSIPSSRHNMVPLLRDMFDMAIEALDRDPDDWTEIDAMQILQLDIQLRDALRSDDYTPGIPIPEALAAALRELQNTLRDLGFSGARNDHEVPVEGDMLKRVRDAGEQVRTLRDGTTWADAPERALNCLGKTLECAEQNGFVRLDTLSTQQRITEKAVGESFRGPGRVISRAVGIALSRWPEQAFPGALLTDGDAPWAPEMIVIPACTGGFLMGTPEGQEGRYDDEFQHEVRIPQMFALARFALTFEEYDAFCADTAREPPDAQNWGRSRHPVINVSWEDAAAWCVWHSDATGAPYRLPTEAEWEYACRGDGSGRNQAPFCPQVARTGQGAFITAEEANFNAEATFNGSPEGNFRKQTLPVDHPEFRANSFGLWQMHGNVLEWCEDVFEENYSNTPTDGSAYVPKPLFDGHARVLRGGSWSYYPQNLRSAYRGRNEPDGRIYNVGFRPARTLFTS